MLETWPTGPAESRAVWLALAVTGGGESSCRKAAVTVNEPASALKTTNLRRLSCTPLDCFLECDDLEVLPAMANPLLE